jgi:hypothetical protein
MDLLEDARAQGYDFDLLLKPVPPTEFLLEVGKMVNATSHHCRSTRTVVVDRCGKLPACTSS